MSSLRQVIWMLWLEYYNIWRISQETDFYIQITVRIASLISYIRIRQVVQSTRDLLQDNVVDWHKMKGSKTDGEMKYIWNQVDTFWISRSKMVKASLGYSKDAVNLFILRIWSIHKYCKLWPLHFVAKVYCALQEFIFRTILQRNKVGIYKPTFTKKDVEISWQVHCLSNAAISTSKLFLSF